MTKKASNDLCAWSLGDRGKSSDDLFIGVLWFGRELVQKSIYICYRKGTNKILIVLSSIVRIGSRWLLKTYWRSSLQHDLELVSQTAGWFFQTPPLKNFLVNTKAISQKFCHPRLFDIIFPTRVLFRKQQTERNCGCVRGKRGKFAPKMRDPSGEDLQGRVLEIRWIPLFGFLFGWIGRRDLRYFANQRAETRSNANYVEFPSGNKKYDWQGKWYACVLSGGHRRWEETRCKPQASEQ